MMIKYGARMWRCKEPCTLTSKLLKERSGVHSTPDDSFRGTQTKYLRLRIALDTLYTRMRVMCDSTTLYAENLSAVAQALMEAPVCLADDQEERQEFSRRAAKIFDETMRFSELVRRSVLDPLGKKLELFSAQEQGLSNRRKLKVEFDSLMKEIRDVRDSTRSVREKIMRRIVDASEMDSALHKEMPGEMARLKELEFRKSDLESQLKDDTAMMTSALATMEDQSLSLTRQMFSVITLENKRLLESANQIFHSKKSTRRRETLTPRVKPQRETCSMSLRFRLGDEESGAKKTTSRKEFERSTKSVLRNVNMRGKLKKALGLDVGVGIDTVGSMDRPISTIGSPLPPPRSSSKKPTRIGDIVRITSGKYEGKEARIVRQGNISSRWKLIVRSLQKKIGLIEYPESKFERIYSLDSKRNPKENLKGPPPLPSSPRTPPPLPITRPKTIMPITMMKSSSPKPKIPITRSKTKPKTQTTRPPKTRPKMPRRKQKRRPQV